jgi:hypothetical protein
MRSFLNKPYPFNEDLRHNAKIILFISLGILAFLLIFQPIDIASFTRTQIFYLVTGLAASTFLVLSLNLIVLPSLFPKIFDNNRWNVKREILWNLWILVTITGSDILFYSKLFGLIDIAFSDIGRIVLLGFLPVSVLIIINQDRLLRSHLKSAQSLSEKLIESKQIKDKMIHFKSDYKKDDLLIKSDALYFIKSADNYIEVYYLNDGSVEKQMIRSSLSQAELSIQEFDFIMRCHRTFIVNINHIKDIKGNSQGLKLLFDGVDFPALVSPKYLKVFKKYI